MANEWDLNVLAAMDKANKLQNNTSGVDNTVMPTNVADTFGLTKGGQKQQQPQSDLYALQEKKRIAALEAQKRSALASLQTEKQQINPAFNTALSNVAGQSARQARNLAEYLAQRGQTQSGLAAQAEMQRYSDLSNQQGLLEQQRANALSDIAQRETQVRSAYDEGTLQALLDRQIAESAYQQQLAEQQRAESINTVGQYGQDYAAEINRIQSEIATGDNSRAYLLPYLQMARQDKVAGIQQAQAKQAQQEFENWLAMQKLNRTSGRSGSNGITADTGVTKDEAFAYDYDQAAKGLISPYEVTQNRASLIAQYGLAKFNQILKAAEANYSEENYRRKAMIEQGFGTSWKGRWY